MRANVSNFGAGSLNKNFKKFSWGEKCKENYFRDFELVLNVFALRTMNVPSTRLLLLKVVLTVKFQALIPSECFEIAAAASRTALWSDFRSFFQAHFIEASKVIRKIKSISQKRRIVDKYKNE